MTARAAYRLRPLLAILLGFFAGALPLSNYVARRRAGVDLRDVGSGTVSGTGLARVAGTWPLIAIGVFEVAKGAVGPLVARSDAPVFSALAGGAAVSGHNWSPLLGGAGGRGISPAMGALLVNAPAGAVLLVGGLLAGRLAGETAVGSLVADVALVPVCGRLHGRRGAVAAAAVLAPMLAKRLLGNAPPARRRPATYLSRLVFDRDTVRRAAGTGRRS